MAAGIHPEVQALPPIVVPYAGTEAELIQAGRDVADLLTHPGFERVLEAAESLARIKDNTFAQAHPSQNIADYADLIGEKRGLRSFRRLAEGIVVNSKQAVQNAEEE